MNEYPILKVMNLKKAIKGKTIIKGISFDVAEGEVFGFLGPNGSGKTTTIRMLVGLIRPSSGTIFIGGKDLQKSQEEALKQIGCIVENPELYPYLTGYENLALFARMLKGISHERILEVVELVGLEQRIHDRVKTYSLGMRQRLGIAQALLGKPKLLILDEPTNGLDPQGIKEMRSFIRNLAASGISVFVSSHLLSEIQLLCDRVAIIRRGEVIAVGKVDELLNEAGTYIEWITDNKAKTIAYFSSIGVSMIQPNGSDETEFVFGERVCTRNDISLNSQYMNGLSHLGINIFAVQLKNPTLEDLFLRLTEGEQIG